MGLAEEISGAIRIKQATEDAGKFMPDTGQLKHKIIMRRMPVYSQQATEPSRCGFRNSDAEPWIWYSLPKDQRGVTSFSWDRHGFSPQPDWTITE